MIGAFPPPIHGMAVINRAVHDRLRSAGAKPAVVDVSAKSLDRRLSVRMSRFPKILRALTWLICTQDLRGMILYLSVSGGLGQFYEIFISLLARLRGMRLFMHHHNFSYLNIRSHCTKILIKTAGSSSVHVTLSAEMAKKLREMYNAQQTITVSNAVFCIRDEVPTNKLRKTIRTIGFISNISAQKGIFEFIDLMASIESVKYPLNAKLAGPFQDSRVKHDVYKRLAEMQNVEYVGPKFGSDRDDFFEHIDLLVFPTHYNNEAEPLIVLEALSHGVPIIAYGRGCIPEIIGSNCGKIVDTERDFVPTALKQIKEWLLNPNDFEAVSQAATRRYIEIYGQNNKKWLELKKYLLNDTSILQVKNSKTALRHINYPPLKKHLRI